VDELLNSFWKKVFIPQPQIDIQQALDFMELEAPIPLPQLKVQYRRLAQRYHPDKGGDSEHFKQVCQAFHQLKRYNIESF
jgi:DnaJ-domain-containing protein 1